MNTLSITNRTKRISIVIISVICIFLCRYNFKLKGIPFTTLEIVQLIGFVYLFLLYLQSKLHLSKKLLRIFILTILIGVASLMSALRDMSGALPLVRAFLGLFFYFGISLYIVNSIQKGNRNFDWGPLCDVWIYSSLLQIVITLVFFLNNDIYELVYSFLDLNQIADERTELLSIRMIGLGNSFFGAGFNYSLDLMVMTLLPYSKDSRINNNKLLYWLICCLIIVVGFLSARTFIVGIACSLLFVFINERKHIWHFAWNSIKVLLVLSILVFVIYQIFLKKLDNIELIFNWAFELFINFFSGEGMRSNSTDVLMDMYVFPDNLSTWIIGDGKFMMPDGSYYMHTDVGFIRLIFFFGLPLTILYYVSIYITAKTAYRHLEDKVFKSFLLCMVLLILLCNLKGFINGSFFFTLFLMYALYGNKNYYVNMSNAKGKVQLCAKE